MRWAGVFALVGAGLGAILAVIVHFLSWTVPRTFYLSAYQAAGEKGGQFTFATPRIHPSWWPTLPAAVVAGAAVGLAAGIALRMAGVRLVREPDRGGDG